MNDSFGGRNGTFLTASRKIRRCDCAHDAVHLIRQVGITHVLNMPLNWLQWRFNAQLTLGAAAVEGGMGEEPMPSWNRGHIVGQKPPLKP